MEPAAPDGAMLEMDCPCVRCGYNLRGLRRDGKCPECAAPVSAGLAGNLLAFADPRWVWTLLLGSRLILAAAGVLIVTGLGVIAVYGLQLPHTSQQQVARLGQYAALILAIGAAWLITTPNAARFEPSWSSRLLARWLLVGTLLGTAVVVMQYGPNRLWRVPPGVWIGLAALACFNGWLLLLYFAGLARRTQAQDVLRRAVIGRWALLAAGLGTLALVVEQRLGLLVWPQVGPKVLDVLQGCLVATLAIAALFPAYFLTNLQRALREARGVVEGLGLSGQGESVGRTDPRP